jgi:hypothetical protein
VTASKRSASDDKDLKATVKKLRTRLDKAEASAKRWKKEARRQQEAAARSDRQVQKLSKRLDKASRAAESSEVGTRPKVVIPQVVVNPEAPSMTDAPATAAISPDATWTVLELRAEARSRGLTGLSRKSKAELLSALG